MQGASVLLILIIFPVMDTSAATSRRAVSLPGCPDKCGDVSIPYPFGIGTGCAAASLSSYFTITCNNTFQPSRPMISGGVPKTREVIDISLEHSEMRMYGPVGYSCFTSNTTMSDNTTSEFSLEGTPFIPSTTRNRFMAIGCNTLGFIGGSMHGDTDPYVTGCYSYCRGLNSTSDGAPCTGMGCCETTIGPNLINFTTALYNLNIVWKFNPCFYSMLAEVGWYSFKRRDLVTHLGFVNDRAKRGVPVVHDWAIRKGSCPEEGEKAPKDYACVSSNSYCVNPSNGLGYLCNCSEGYEGNPYLPTGCQDIDECQLRKQDPKFEQLYPCNNGVCQNQPGSYKCKCMTGTRPDGTNYGCQTVLHKAEQVAIGLGVSAFVLMALTCFLVMKIQRKKHMKEKDGYFKQNGGLKLYDEMRSRQVDTVLILTEKEIKKATDNYSDNRVLGCGGHGTVYRGTLDNDKELAIKKSKVVGDGCREEFVNEIIILSQINHRNIVRLHGCCLEVDVPMLVYEFISNGTLFEFLHGNERRSTIPLDFRLKIATQSAEALSYIHSSTSRTILHGDVKSLNILLDDEYNAKVADFGASALKSLDKDDFIMFIQGTLGYLDPETFVSHHLTEKSDVYSFGVVLVELMTRKKAIYNDDFNGEKSLSHTFASMFHQNKLSNVLDNEIIEDEVMVVLWKLAELAMHCLSPRGDERPTMKEVAERLQMLRRIQMQLVTKSNPTRVHYSYGGSSTPATPDKIKYQSMDTAKLVLDVDNAR